MISYLEIVDYTFSVKVVVRDGKEIPVESFTPRILLLRRLFSIDGFYGKESSNFAVNCRLTEHNEENHVSVAQ